MKNRWPTHVWILMSFVLGATTAFGISYAIGLSPTLTPIFSAALGLIVAFAIPLWQTYFLNAPKLEVEISAIRRSVSDDATVILADYPELNALSPRRTLVEERWFSTHFGSEELDIGRSPGNRSSIKVADLDAIIERAKQQIKDLPERIEITKKEFEKVQNLTEAALTKTECDRLNIPLNPEIEFDANNRSGVLQELRNAYQKRLEGVEKRLADLQANLPAAERKVETLKHDLLGNRSFFTVSASLVNSGRTNTAIKAPALLRVSIGEGNYIDIKLTVKDFETKSEISANGTRIVIFESPEISTFPEDDRRLINTYWGQSVSVRLFVEDIHERCYGSNKIAFAEGLYQKIIYDRLAQFASSEQVRRSP